MSMGEQDAKQPAMWLSYKEVAASPGHRFYEKLNALLAERDFDRAVEALCAPHYAAENGRPSIPPGVYFRMLLIGYFEGIESERGMHRKRGELLERTFAHICETGAHRRTRLRGIDNMRKRYVLQCAAANLGLVMRTLFGNGTPRGFADRVREAAGRCFAAFFVLWFVMANTISRRLRTAAVKIGFLARRLSPPIRVTTIAFSTGC